MEHDEMNQMLMEYMEKGFLENIVALFKTDASLYAFIPGMLSDGNMRVRLGTAALVEELAGNHPDELKAIVSGLTALLTHENPNVRGDTAYVLGIIRDHSAEVALRAALNDENPGVRESARGALEEIGSKVTFS
jgi:HEAT repeat protein